jgi:AcrR family transcriptional regulator
MSTWVALYGGGVPRLWSETIDEHRRTVHAAVLDATAALIAEQGLAAATMSQIATRAGIGRATLYKYFPDVEAIVVAWHERQIADHLRRLTEAAAAEPDPAERLRTVLSAYAELSTTGRDHGPELAVPLHRAEHVRHAHAHLRALLSEVIAAAAAAGAARTDVAPAELAAFCAQALAAHDLPAARAVALTLSALRPAS